MSLPHTQALPVRCANHFGNIEIKARIEDMEQLGFSFGDSVSVEFSNGFSYRGIPYYNSFLGPGDKPCLYGMAEAYEYVGIGYPVAGNPWKECGATDEDRAIIYLCEKGSYEVELNTYGMTIQSSPDMSMSAAEFANFRPLAIGDASSTMFYRCANPLRADTHCSQQAMACLESLKPNFVINLSDSRESIESYCQEKADSHYARLWKNNALCALRPGVDYTSAPFAETVASAFSELLEYPAPYLIHCRYGVDRTGFLCVLLEALAGSPYPAIISDYMASYKNVYGIAVGSKKYQAIQKRRFAEIERYLCSLADLCPGTFAASSDAQGSLRKGAASYLLKAGMQRQTLEELEVLLLQQ